MGFELLKLAKLASSLKLIALAGAAILTMSFLGWATSRISAAAVFEERLSIVSQIQRENDATETILEREQEHQDEADDSLQAAIESLRSGNPPETASLPLCPTECRLGSLTPDGG